MSDGITVTGTIELKRMFKQLFEFPEKDRKAILRGCAKEAAPDVLTAHYEKHKGEWAPQKNGKEQLVKTGNMLRGIKSKKAPASLRKITVSKIKKANCYRISISLRQMVNGKNVYTYAQMGRAVSATGKTKFGRTKTVGLRGLNKSGLKQVKVNRVGRRMVCQSEPGDEKFFSARIETALRTYLTKMAKKAKK